MHIPWGAVTNATNEMQVWTDADRDQAVVLDIVVSMQAQQTCAASLQELFAKAADLCPAPRYAAWPLVCRSIVLLPTMLQWHSTSRIWPSKTRQSSLSCNRRHPWVSTASVMEDS